MRASIGIIGFLLLFLFVGQTSAERKPLEVIQRQFKLGKSLIPIPNPRGRDPVDAIEKTHEVHFDSTTGLYTYVYWRENGEKVEIFYEPANRVKVTVACSVSYDEASGEYTYTYRVKNSRSSAQPLSGFLIDMDPNLVLRTEIPDSWEYFSRKAIRSPWAPERAIFGSLGGDIPPGEEMSITIISKQGPVLTTCYADGRARKFGHPSEIGPGRVSTTREGVKGKTLAPGKISVQKEAINKYVRKIMDVAREWGWIDVATYHQALGKIPASQPLDRAGLAALMRDFRNVEPGVREPEVGALLDHLGRRVFGMRPESIVPGGASQP